MNQLLRAIINILPLKPSINYLINLTKKKILLPFYHTVSDEKLPHISNLYKVRNVKLFLQDLDYLMHNFHPIGIEELYSIILSEKQLKEPVFHLSFDDGLKEFYTIIAPILEEMKIPATVFLNTAYIDNKDIFYRYKASLIVEHINRCTNNELKNISQLLHISSKSKNKICEKVKELTHDDEKVIQEIADYLKINFVNFLKKQQPYLNTDQVNDLIKRGFSIGSHGVTHPLYKLLSLNEQKFQVEQSFNFLMENFGIKRKYFSFPFNDEGVSRSFFEWFENQGYLTSFGISGLKDDCTKFHQHRLPMEGTLHSAEELIESEYLYFIFKKIVNKNRIHRR